MAELDVLIVHLVRVIAINMTRIPFLWDSVVIVFKSLNKIKKRICWIIYKLDKSLVIIGFYVVKLHLGRKPINSYKYNYRSEFLASSRWVDFFREIQVKFQFFQSDTLSNKKIAR